MALNEQQLQVKSETAAAVFEGVRERVAELTKEKYEFLRLIEPSLPEKPTDQQFRAWGAELIDNRSINGIKLDQMNKKLLDQENGRVFLSSQGVSNLSQLIPNNEQATKIANEVGEAVASNTPTGWIEKRWKAATNGFSKKGAVDAVAADAASATSDRLDKLVKTRPDMTAFLKPEVIAELSDAVSAGVNNKAIEEGTITGVPKPKVDRVAKAKIQPIDAATKEAIFSGFGSVVYDKTQSTINQRIESARGDGFKGFMMGLLEIPILGDIIKAIAGLFGFDIPKIPSQNDIHNVSTVVSKSTTDVVRENAARMSRTELVEAVRSTTLANLQANRANYTAFTDEQLAEMASGAAQGVNENYDRIPRIAPSDAVRGQAVAAAQPGRGMTQGGEQATTAPAQVLAARGSPTETASGRG